nr:Golgi-associated RAB2B interactor protein 3-like isoform X9 [Misgurnus anguillicaudatus]
MKPSIWQDMINTEFYRTNLLGIVVDEVHISYKLASALIMELSHLLRHQTSVQAAPAGPTAAPAGPTAAPAGPTAAPAGPTAAPAGPTAAPAGPTAAPAGPTAAPAGPTAAPAGPTAAPAGPTAAPAGPTAVPAGRLTAIPPGSITRLPGPTAGLPGPTTDLTGQTVRAPFLEWECGELYFETNMQNVQPRSASAHAFKPPKTVQHQCHCNNDKLRQYVDFTL